MPRVSPFFLLPLLCLSLGSCGAVSKALHSHHKKVDEDKTPKDLFIGVIEMVNPEQHFVLIKTGIQLKLQPGWKLETRPNTGDKAVLTITPEQKLNFLSADIVDGFPQRGEIVVLPPQLGTAAVVPGQQPLPPGQPSLPGGNLPLPSATQPPAPPPSKPLLAPNGEVLPPPIP